jgi:hypothetical protein
VEVGHSNVRSSKPRFPGEIRANLNLCLQGGHIGRSIVEANLLTATHASRYNTKYWNEMYAAISSAPNVTRIAVPQSNASPQLIIRPG